MLQGEVVIAALASISLIRAPISPWATAVGTQREAADVISKAISTTREMSTAGPITDTLPTQIVIYTTVVADGTSVHPLHIPSPQSTIMGAALAATTLAHRIRSVVYARVIVMMTMDVREV